MASRNLCLLILLAVFLVLALEVDAGRRNGRRREGGRGRGGGRRHNPGNQDNSEIATNDNVDVTGADDVIDAETDALPRGRGGRGRGGGRRGGRQRGRGRGRGRGGRGGRGRGNRPAEDVSADRILEDYAVSNGRFGVDLYKEMSDRADNFAISPVSVHSALGMLLLGSSGRTKTELVRGLHVRSPIHQGFRIYNQSLALGEEEDITLVLANALYTQPDVVPKDNYVNNLRTFYRSEVAQFDEEDPEGAINDWVSGVTMGKIPEFLNDGDVEEDTAMMLLNAMYFKGLWKDAFDEDLTTVETFRDTNGVEHDVPTLNRQGQYQMLHSPVLGARTLRLPCEGNRHSLNLVLPDDGVALTTVESRLTHDLLRETLGNLRNASAYSVSVSFPKFSLDTEQSLKELLENMGIVNIFEDSANFRRMSTSSVAVRKVKHRSIIEIDESGTEAAAATGVDIVAVMLPPQFHANKPFMFVLSDDAASVNLFMGRYVNPQGDNIMV